MQITTLKMKTRKPRETAIAKATKEGTAIPIERQPFEVQVPTYDVQDILQAVESNDQKVLGYLSRLLNAEVVSNIRAQLSDDEQFPVDQEIEVENFDKDQWTLDALATVTIKTSAAEFSFEDEDFKEFERDFVAVLLPVFQGVARAETKLINTANVLINGFKDVRNEPEKMEKVKGTLDKFMGYAPDSIVEKYADMYDWFCAMQDKRMKAFNKRQEKTDVSLD